MSKYDPRNIAIPSSGDAEKDRRDIQDHIRSSMRIDEGLCPNHVDHPTALVEVEPATWTCPDCSFLYQRRTLVV